MEDVLIRLIDKQDVEGTASLLQKGANATKITSNGRSAIGHAAFKGHYRPLEILLQSCARDEANPSSEDATKDANKISTPEDMNGLQWEEEIEQDITEHHVYDDEWSRLYVYYAQMIEKTGALLTNTIRTKDPHCLDAYNFAPIHYAAKGGHAKCVELLLDHRCPVNMSTHTGVTPLHLAVKHPDAVRVLLANRADTNAKKFHNSETPLHAAIIYGCTWVAEQLISRSESDVNASCHNEQTPLLLAAQARRTDIATLLLKRGALVNAQDSYGNTALLYAVLTQNYELADILLRHGARVLVRHYLMHNCVRNNWKDMLELLVKHDPEGLNIRDQAGWTPLYRAIYDRNASIIEYLIKHGAQLNCKEWFMKELQIMIQHSPTRDSFRPSAYILLQNGVDIDHCNYWGESPLIQAIMLEKYQIAEFLVKEGGDVNVGDTKHCPDTLLLVRRTDNINLLTILINAGMKFHSFSPRDLQLKAGPWPNADTNIDHCLAVTYRKPLSLQQISRIAIRNKLIAKMKVTMQTFNHHPLPHVDGSVLKYCVSLTGLPKKLQDYIYDFTDVPSVIDMSSSSSARIIHI